MHIYLNSFCPVYEATAHVTRFVFVVQLNRCLALSCALQSAGGGVWDRLCVHAAPGSERSAAFLGENMHCTQRPFFNQSNWDSF